MLSVPDSTPGHLPLVIGATGHRDLRTADRPVLEQTTRRAIEELRDQCPHTPLIVLSALAEGADRLVARVALDLGFSLIVALPMPQAEYEKDFDKPGSLDEFQALLGQAKWRFVVAEAENIELTGLGGNARSQRYALAGAFIVQSSQVVLALWDGVDTNKIGGTFQVVRYAQLGVPRHLADLLKGTTGPNSAASTLDEPVGQGLVKCIPTPRVSQPQSARIARRPRFTSLTPRATSSGRWFRSGSSGFLPASMSTTGTNNFWLDQLLASPESQEGRASRPTSWPETLPQTWRQFATIISGPMLSRAISAAETRFLRPARSCSSGSSWRWSLSACTPTSSRCKRHGWSCVTWSRHGCHVRVLVYLRRHAVMTRNIPHGSSGS